MAININMNKEQYESFMRCLQAFNKKASDISIVNGKIYQFNNGKRVLYDIDLSQVIGINTIYLSNFDYKYNLLDIFKKQYSAVDVEITKDRYIFSDKDSSIEFKIPDPRSMIIKSSIEGSNQVNSYTATDENNIILECTLEPFIIERIIHAQKTLDTDKISIACDGGEAQLIMTMGDNNNTAHVFKILECSANEAFSGVAQFPIDPFQLNTEGMDVTLYSNVEDDSLVILKTKTKLGIDPQIPVTMASLSPFAKKK